MSVIAMAGGFDCTRKKGVGERTKNYDGLHNIQWREALASFYLPRFVI